MTTTPKQRVQHMIAMTTLTIAVMWFWRGCLVDFFAQDDFLLLYDAAATTNLAAALFDIGAVDNMYRPISTTFYFFVINKLVGLAPMPYHLCNLLLHLCSVLLVYALLRQLSVGRVMSWAGAMFVATRSLGFAVVYWVAGVQVLLMSALCLASAVVGLYYLKSGKRSMLCCSIIAFALAVGSKGDVLVFPACALLLGLTQRQQRRTIVWCVLLGLVSLSFYGLHQAVTFGYEHPYDFGAPRLALLKRYIDWTMYGLPGSLEGWTVAIFIVPALVVAPIVLSTTTKQSQINALLLFIAGCIMSVPSILLQTRAATYYAYLPAMLFVISMVLALTLLPLTLRVRQRVEILVCILVLFSSYAEYRLNERKNQSPMVAIKNGEDIIPTGGWLNTARRDQYPVLLEHLRKQQPSKAIVLKHWDELYVAGRSTDGSRQLRPVSPTELMARLFTQSPNIQLRFLNNQPKRDHELSPTELRAFINEHNRDVIVMELDPVTAEITKLSDASLPEYKQIDPQQH
jgi:hypothetical protein